MSDITEIGTVIVPVSDQDRALATLTTRVWLRRAWTSMRR